MALYHTSVGNRFNWVGNGVAHGFSWSFLVAGVTCLDGDGQLARRLSSNAEAVEKAKPFGVLGGVFAAHNRKIRGGGW